MNSADSSGNGCSSRVAGGAPKKSAGGVTSARDFSHACWAPASPQSVNMLTL